MGKLRPCEAEPELEPELKGLLPIPPGRIVEGELHPTGLKSCRPSKRGASEELWGCLLGQAGLPIKLEGLGFGQQRGQGAGQTPGWGLGSRAEQRGQAALAGLPSPAPGPAREVELKHSSSFLSFVGSDVAHFLDVQARASNNSAVRKPGRGCSPVPGPAPSLPTS